MIYFEILDKKRQRIFEELKFTKKFKLYLGGGTALALQLGHRKSLDFDFFSQEKFSSKEIRNLFYEGLKGKVSFKVLRNIEDTFEIEIEKSINLSCFYYPYKLLKPLKEFKEIFLASLEDISAMKIIAISQRGRRRDFVDIYFLIKKFGLKQILEFAQKKFPEFDIYCALRGLIYFEDANKDREVITKPKVRWKEIKKFLIKEIEKMAKKLD